MNKLFFAALCILLSMTSCASYTQRGRLETLDETVKAYERALTQSDYASASGFIDPSARIEAMNYDQYKNIKIVDCKTTHVDVSDNGHKVTQEVQLQYFLRDRNILKAVQYQQVWQYAEETKAWLLESNLPVFHP